MSPQRTLAEEVWNTCQSHAGQNASYFLPWHRFYTWRMERIVRQVSGVADFTMPYWDYTSTDPAKRGVVPEQFRLPDDPVWGVLYRPNRTTLANTGQPIHLNQPGDAMNIDDVMAKTDVQHRRFGAGLLPRARFGHPRPHPHARRQHARHGQRAVCRQRSAVLRAPRQRRPHVGQLEPQRQQEPDRCRRLSVDHTSFALADENGARMSRQMQEPVQRAAAGLRLRPVLPEAARRRPGAGDHDDAGEVRRRQRGQGRRRRQAAANLAASEDDGEAGAPVHGEGDRRARPGCRQRAARCSCCASCIPGSSRACCTTCTCRATPDAPVDARQYVGNINFFDAEFHDHGGGSKLDEALGENFYSFDVTKVLQDIAKKPHRPRRATQLFVKLRAGRQAGGRREPDGRAGGAGAAVSARSLHRGSPPPPDLGVLPATRAKSRPCKWSGGVGPRSICCVVERRGGAVHGDRGSASRDAGLRRGGTLSASCSHRRAFVTSVEACLAHREIGGLAADSLPSVRAARAPAVNTAEPPNPQSSRHASTEYDAA